MRRWVPWILGAVFAMWVVAALRPPPEQTGFNLAEFGRLPAKLNGRLQPLDSVARNALLILRGKQSALAEQPGRKWWQPPRRLRAIEWFLEVAAKPELADERPVFRLDHPELRGLLRLPPEGPFYCAYRTLKPHLEEIERQARRANAVQASRRSTFERAALRLHQALWTYQRLKNALRPEDAEDFPEELQQYHKNIATGLAAAKQREAGQPFNQQDFDRLLESLRRYQVLDELAFGLLIPPSAGAGRPQDWQTLGASLMEAVHQPRAHPAVTNYAALATAYRKGQSSDFNRAVAAYSQWLKENAGPERRQARREFLFHQWEPFYKSAVLYLGVFLLGCFSWFGCFQALNRSGFGLLALGFLVHTAGVIFRMVLEGRPPVTNLYSSAVFVGWGAVLLGLVLEWRYRDSIGLVMAGVIGLGTQIIAHNLSLEGNTMEVLEAVLDTNFWLATHVITIILGYSAGFVAGFLAALYVVRGLFTRGLREATARYLARSVYGLVCFATLFSFLGTVLGGIWADQSWGRFWGWDPKENGALIIVLWNALILHAWRGGLVRERGLMNLALFGNVTISFAWFGVNMLGVGLHSYAFMDRAFDWLAGFVLSQLLLIANGLLHRRYWRSFGLPSSPLLWAVRGTAVLLSAGALVTGMSGRWLGALVWLVCLLFFVAVANLVAANWLAGEPPEAPAPVSPAQ